MLIACLVAGCAAPRKYEDMRHRAESAEAENARLLQFIAGAHEDNAMLQQHALELEMVIRAYEGGMIEQAKENARVRSLCDV